MLPRPILITIQITGVEPFLNFIVVGDVWVAIKDRKYSKPDWFHSILYRYTNAASLSYNRTILNPHMVVIEKGVSIPIAESDRNNEARTYHFHLICGNSSMIVKTQTQQKELLDVDPAELSVDVKSCGENIPRNHFWIRAALPYIAGARLCLQFWDVHCLHPCWGPD